MMGAAPMHHRACRCDDCFGAPPPAAAPEPPNITALDALYRAKAAELASIRVDLALARAKVRALRDEDQAYIRRSGMHKASCSKPRTHPGACGRE